MIRIMRYGTKKSSGHYNRKEVLQTKCHNMSLYSFNGPSTCIDTRPMLSDGIRWIGSIINNQWYWSKLCIENLSSNITW